MTNQEKWVLMRVIGFILMCIGLIAAGIATQGASVAIEITGLSGLLLGFCVFTYGLVKSWWNK